METALGLAFVLPILGLLVMTVMPKDWQNVQGWLLVSYVGLPGFVALAAFLVNFPVLLIGAVFFAGIYAAKK